TAFGGLGPTAFHEPERACDAALDAILVALDGSDAAQRRLGLTVPPGAVTIPNDAVLAWRGVEILALVGRLMMRRPLLFPGSTNFPRGMPPHSRAPWQASRPPLPPVLPCRE